VTPRRQENGTKWNGMEQALKLQLSVNQIFKQNKHLAISAFSQPKKGELRAKKGETNRFISLFSRCFLFHFFKKWNKTPKKLSICK
jgi:hypothetical protein